MYLIISKNCPKRSRRLYSKEDLSDKEIKELDEMKVELDQCWDLLRQRHALKDAGKNPDDAKVKIR